MRIMKCFNLLFFVFLISCASKNNTETISVIDKPNILFISIDDLNDWSGFQRNFPNVRTPNIDRLAARGMVFTNAYCQAPLCAPSRTSLFTGLYPHTTGLYYQFSDEDIRLSSSIAEKSTLLPDYLEKHGYKTMGVGKIFHNGDRLAVFQEYGGVFPKMAFGPRPEQRVNYNPKWFSDSRRTATDWSPINLPDSAMSDYKIAEWAVDKLDDKHDKPFFMSVGFVRPHVPWHVPPKWFDLFDETKIVLPAYKSDDFNDIPENSKRLHEIPAMPNTEWLIEQDKWKGMVKSYLACMTFVDAQLGKVLDGLEDSRYKDNTIIVLWSDHGYHLGEKGRTAKHSLWERATHIPLILAGKDIIPGTKIDAPVGLIDLYPTLLDIANLPPNIENEGNSLAPLTKNINAEWPHMALTSYGYKNMSVYNKDFHFIQYRDGSEELYNLIEDPNEWNNLCYDSSYSDIKKILKEYLPKVHAPLSHVNRLNVNTYIDEELREFGIENSLKNK